MTLENSGEEYSEWKEAFLRQCERHRPWMNCGCWQFISAVVVCPVCQVEQPRATAVACIRRKNHTRRKDNHLKLPKQYQKKTKLTMEEVKVWEEYLTENGHDLEYPMYMPASSQPETNEEQHLDDEIDDIPSDHVFQDRDPQGKRLYVGRDD